MRIPIPSNNKRFRVKIGVCTSEPMALGVRCFDSTHVNTDYIRRRIPFEPIHRLGKRSYYREFTLPFPVSPQKLVVDLYDRAYGGDEGFNIEKFELEAIEPAEIWAEPEIHDFIGFAEDFAQKAGYTNTGFYDSKDGEFLIQYLPFIPDEYNQPVVTPARTNRKTSRIQVSQSAFVKYTIPIRVFVLFHERYHFQLPTRREKPADLNALRLYLDLDYPRMEAVYAATKIFNSHPETVGPQHLARVADMVNFIDDYSLRKGKTIY